VGFEQKLSRAEEITNEVRKLVFTCRSLEAQLQQSLPKKFHQEVVAKMQGNIDSLSADLASTRSELEKTLAIAQKVEGLEAQVTSQNETISSQAKTIDSLATKLSETEVYVTKYSEASSMIQELESRISTMVESSAYTSLQTRCSELEAQLSNMVPKEQFEAIQAELANSVPVQKFEELKKRLEQMVPREQLTVAESRISELEKSLAESVPKADFDELAGKIAQITKEAIELASRASAAIGLESPVPAESDSSSANMYDSLAASQQVDVSTTPASPPDVAHPTIEMPEVEHHADSSVVATAVPETSSATPVTAAEPFQVESHAETQEIAEVQSQLSEISAAIETGASSIPPVQSQTIVEPEKGFRFSNTEFCARSGMEFLEDLEKVDISVVATHCQSGDFERWFKDVLADEAAAQSIQKIRESNVSGEEMRAMMVAAIAPRYKT
jgi:hypothetical protein